MNRLDLAMLDRRLAAAAAKAPSPSRRAAHDARDALAVRDRAFIKPTDEKIFPARRYADGAAVDPDAQLPLDAGTAHRDRAERTIVITAIALAAK